MVNSHFYIQLWINQFLNSSLVFNFKMFARSKQTCKKPRITFTRSLYSIMEFLFNNFRMGNFRISVTL